MKKGDLQVTQAERQKNSEAILRDIANVVADKCVNSETKVIVSKLSFHVLKSLYIETIHCDGD